MHKLLFCQFQVTNLKLINEKNPINITVPMFVNPEIVTILYISKKTPRTVCLGVAQVCSKLGVAWMQSPTDGNLSGLRLGTTSLLVPETFKFKVLIM